MFKAVRPAQALGGITSYLTDDPTYPTAEGLIPGGGAILASVVVASGQAAQIAGKSWIPPILAQLLDDPYAAVRCVAERSLKRVAPGLIPDGYDYTILPEARPAAQTQVWERWRKEKSAAPDPTIPVPTLVGWNDSKARQDRVQGLIRQRDQRPVRLRE